MLKLPSYQQLSKEQDTIYNLPLADSHLVMGPPGTGKTVMAIFGVWSEGCSRYRI